MLWTSPTPLPDRHRRRGGSGRGAASLPLAFYGKPRAVRKAQLVLMGTGKDDLVDFAVSLQTRIDDLHRVVDEVAAGLARIDRRVDGCLSHTALVRYNAYEDAGGHQSASLAFLDGARLGGRHDAIQGRDYARIYVKQPDRGRAPVALSPEEQEAVDRAMASDLPQGEIRAFRPSDEPLLFGLAKLDRGADRRTLAVLEQETVFVAEVDGAPAGYVALERVGSPAGRPTLRQS